jgi:hypothetical protein
METKAKLLGSIFFVLTNIIISPISIRAGSLPDTGQTKCYNNTAEVACPQPGEPFFGQDAQYNTLQQSYTKLDSNGNELPVSAAAWAMVRDNVTGLMWEIKDSANGVKNYSNPHDADNTYTWYDSNPATNGGYPGTPSDGTDTEDFINDLNSAQFGGFNNWRLPTIQELASIVNREVYIRSINTAFFPNMNTTYWSSTTNAQYSSKAWYLKFWMGTELYYDKSGANPVIAVRGSQSSQSFIDNNDGTITDTVTGLMWQKDGSTPIKNWSDALAYCNDLTLAGYDDWRLPDINQLQSIADYSRLNPSINTTYFSNTAVNSGYWSSTTNTGSVTNAFGVIFREGNISYGSKINAYHVRAVRGGNDSDADGVPDCFDGCPNDANKLQAGICGCGVPDIDTDGDNTPDCIDVCPDDPAKTLPGVCGCGISDTDTDNDGVEDCFDNCPNDSLKTSPGVCGCGVSDIDIDGDGTPDCIDMCPNDLAKTLPGVCGCGIPDTDTDTDGIVDCIDNCPNKPNGPLLGTCTPGSDKAGTTCSSDADCVIGCSVNGNCSKNQDDTDSDGIGDVCDN